MICRDLCEIWSNFETTRTWSKSKLEEASRQFRFVSSYCSNNNEFDWNQNSKNKSSIKLTFQAADNEMNLISDEIRSNAICESDSILSRNTDWLKLKKVNRQSNSFIVIVLSFTNLCVHWSVLISLQWWYKSSQYTV
jgi:hypothetical protein